MRRLAARIALVLVVLILAAAPSVHAGKKNPKDAFYGVTPKIDAAGLD